MQHKINIQPVDDNLEPVQGLPDRSDLSGLYVRSAEVTKDELRIAQEEAASNNHAHGTRKASLLAVLILIVIVIGGLAILLLRRHL